MSVSKLFDISGKTAVITGGSRGIGLMIARGFVEAGAKVYISSRDAKACAEAQTQLGDACIALPHDLGRTEGVKALTDEIKARESKLDILINKATFTLSQALYPLLKAAGTAEDPSRIVNIGSIDGILAPSLETYAYSASKAAVHHLTRNMAKHLAKDNINVNAIAPGPFETKMLAPVLAVSRDAMVAGVPRGRIGQDDDMIGAAIFYCSRASSYVTATVLPVDGGISGTPYAAFDWENGV